MTFAFASDDAVHQPIGDCGHTTRLHAWMEAKTALASAVKAQVAAHAARKSAVRSLPMAWTLETAARVAQYGQAAQEAQEAVIVARQAVKTASKNVQAAWNDEMIQARMASAAAYRRESESYGGEGER